MALSLYEHCTKQTVFDQVTQCSAWRRCNKHRNM